MPRVVPGLGLLLILACAPLTAQQAPAAARKAFWQDVAAKKFAVPAGESVPALVAELSGYLGSPDPVLRDDIGYSTLAQWIYRQRIVPVELRRTLLRDWTANLSAGIGDNGTDAVFRRSFSALALGVLVILDNEAPWLEKAEFDALLAATITYLAAERDVRGFDDVKGWMHSVAHTADVLKFLGRSRHLQPAQQAAILQAIARKLGDVTVVLTHGEDERLARAILSLAARADLDQTAFRDGLTALLPPRAAGAPTSATLAQAQNRKHLLVSLHAVLSTDARTLPALDAARAIVLDTLKKAG